MKEDAPSHEQTSRRQFTKAIVTAAVAAPIVASMASCKGSESQNNSATPSATPTPTGPVIIPCAAGAHGEDHIPPMGIDGGGSLRLELSNKLTTADTQSPFTYVETGITNANERYGELESVVVIAEFFPKVNNEYLSINTYTGFPSGSQLLLWYQKIFPRNEPGPNDPDVGFENVATYPDRDPDVRIIGGPGNGRYFQMIIKHKKLPPQPDKSHKNGRPWRYHHQSDANIPGLGRHFRIGQWRIVNSGGEVVVAPGFEGRGALDYRIYPTFEDFHGS
jgi:hypothetical protein